MFLNLSRPILGHLPCDNFLHLFKDILQPFNLQHLDSADLFHRVIPGERLCRMQYFACWFATRHHLQGLAEGTFLMCAKTS